MTQSDSGQANAPQVLDPAQLDLLLDQLRGALEAQWDTWKFADTRAQFMLGWLLTATTVSLALGLPRVLAAALVTQALIWAAGLAVLAALMLLIAVYSPRDFYRPPDPAELVPLYTGVPLAATKLVLISTLVEAYTVNQTMLDRKLVWSRIAFTLAALGGCVGLLALVTGLVGLGG